MLAGVAALAVVVFGVLVGVVVAVALSLLAALYRVARPHDAILGDHPGLGGWVEVDAYPAARTEPGLLVYRFDAPLFFVNADWFRERVEQVLVDNPGREEWVVLDFEGIGSLDATALDALASLVDRLAELRVETVAVARANDIVLTRLRDAELVEPPGPLRSFPTINSAVRAYRGRQRGLSPRQRPTRSPATPRYEKERHHTRGSFIVDLVGRRPARLEAEQCGRARATRGRRRR